MLSDFNLFGLKLFSVGRVLLRQRFNLLATRKIITVQRFCTELSLIIYDKHEGHPSNPLLLCGNERGEDLQPWGCQI